MDNLIPFNLITKIKELEDLLKLFSHLMTSLYRVLDSSKRLPMTSSEITNYEESVALNVLFHIRNDISNTWIFIKKNALPTGGLTARHAA